MNTEQTLPQQETEQQIIAHILKTGATAAHEASAYLTQHDFSDPELSILYDVTLSLVFLRLPVNIDLMMILLRKYKKLLEQQLKQHAITIDADTFTNNILLRIKALIALHTSKQVGATFTINCRTLRYESRKRTGRHMSDDPAHASSATSTEFVPKIPVGYLLPPAFGGPNLTYIPQTTSLGEDIHTGETMLTLEQKNKSSLIKGILQEQSVNMIFGEEGCGKSLLAMNLALSVATGANRFLEYEIPTHGKVIYLNNELPFSEFLTRFKIMATALTREQQELLGNIIVPETIPSFKDYWSELRSLCHTQKPVLVILDCLYWSHNQQENNSSGMKALMQQFTNLRDRYNVAMVILHHTKKRSRYQTLHSSNMRGSGVFGAATDTNIELRRSEKDETMRILKPVKLRYSNDAIREARLLTLSGDTLWFNDQGKAKESDHITKERKKNFWHEAMNFKEIIQQGETLTRKEIVQRCKNLGFQPRIIDYALYEAKQNGTIQSPKYGFYTIE